MSLVLDGRKIETPGLETVSFLDDPKVPRATDHNPRELPIVGGLLHTVSGKRGPIRPGGKPSSRDFTYAVYQAHTERDVSWDATGDTDGSTTISNDPARRYTWHAGAPAVNRQTIGIEQVQDADGAQYEVQIRAEVQLIELYCTHLFLPRRTPVDQDGKPYAGLLDERLFAGIYGHRNLWTLTKKGERTTMKPWGDPGDAIFNALLAAGFEAVPIDAHGRIAATLGPPPPPPWIDRTQEITDTADRPVDRAAFVREHAAILQGLGLNRDRAAELVAHSGTECAFGRRAIGHNLGGVKLKETDDKAYRAKNGHGLPWWRAQGHVQAGDAAWVYYRGFGSSEEFWRFFLKRYVPADATATERYAATGASFWSDDPARWFVELLRAGYRGVVRRAEVEDLIHDHGNADAHASVKAHRKVVDEVRALLPA